MNRKLCITALVGILWMPLGALAVDFDWQPGEVSAKVKPADKLKIGQYLYVNRPGSNAGTWNMAKLNLPESWKVKSVKVDGRKILVTTSKSGNYEITPKNLKTLWTKLRKVKDSSATDEALEKIWKAEALFVKRRRFSRPSRWCSWEQPPVGTGRAPSLSNESPSRKRRRILPKKQRMPSLTVPGFPPMRR